VELQRHSSAFPIADFFLDAPIELLEVESRAIEFLKNKLKGLVHGDSTLFNHVYKIFVILKNHGCNLSVCLAGLFYFFYIDERIKLTDRDVLRELIGINAEEIVYRFSNLQNRDAELLSPSCKDYDLVHLVYAILIDAKFKNLSLDDEIVTYKIKLEEVKR
jgi:hypothetical protein